MSTVPYPQVPQKDGLPVAGGRVMAVVNQKGGVAKTTTAINLATAIAQTGKRVLLVDMDPQGNLTSGVGLKGQRAPGGTAYDALLGEAEPITFVLPSSVPGLSLIPADRNLTGAEIELVPLPEREHRLRRVIEPLRTTFDYAFIDCPPSLGLLTLNSLVAADSVIIPLHCEYFALEGLAELIGTMRRVRAAFNPLLDVEGVLLTMHDERTNLGQQVAREVRGYFGRKVFETIIPRNVRLSEAPSHGIPGVIYDPRSRGATAYVALSREMLDRRASTEVAGPTGGTT